MAEKIKITPDMTVKDINIKYPACQEVFKKFGIGGCGGQYGPPEPVDFFASAHNVNLDVLIHDLEEAASAAPGQAVKPSSLTQEEVDEARLNKLYKLFIKAALVFTLTGGTLWGVIALTWIAVTASYSAPYYALTQAHGHMQTLGWVGLFIMGVAYYVIPKFKMSKLRDTALAYLSFILMTTGITMRGIAQPLAYIKAFSYLNVLSGALELIAVGCFGYLMIRTAAESKERHEFFEKYLFASIGYFFILMLWNFFIVIDMFANNSIVIGQPYNSIFLHLLLVGFVGMMILGVSMRVLPHFMGLKEPNSRLSNISFYLFNIGIILNVVGYLIEDYLLSSHLLFLSYLLEFHGALFFVIALKIFAKPRTILNIQGVDNAYMRFIKLSYFWFFVSVVMIFLGSYYQLKTLNEIPHFYIGAYRHAFTVGFITTIMMGVAYRVLPVFNGTSLYSNKIMRASFFLILFGNIARVVFQLGTGFFGKPAFLLMGTSGYFEFTALALFSYNIWKTLNYCEPAIATRGATEAIGSAVSETSKLYEVLTQHPELRETFVGLGFKKLSDPNFVKLIPKFVTLSQACKVEGVDLNKVIETLNNKLKG